MKNKIPFFLAIACCISLKLPTSGLSRTVVLTGSGDIGTEYNSNIFRTDNNQVSEWQSYIAPVLDLTAPGPSDNIKVTLSPTYTYNHRRDENYFNTDLAAFFEKSLSSKFKYNLSNDFSYSNNPPSEALRSINLSQQFVELAPEIQSEIVRLLFPEFNWPGGQFDPNDRSHVAIVQSEIQGRYNAASPAVKDQVDALFRVNTIDRRNYFTDIISFNGYYEYFKDCLVSFGYSFSKEESDTSFQSDLESHNLNFEVQHKFSKEVELSGSYNYVNSSYDISDDSEDHETDLKMSYQLNHANLLSIAYNYSLLDYKGEQFGHNTNRLTFEADHSFTEKTTMNFSASPYIIDNDSGIAERGYELALNLSQVIKHGQISLESDWSVAESETAGSWDDLRQSWSVGTTMQYEILANLNTDTHLSYGERQNWIVASKNTYNDYEAGVTVSYPLNKFLVGHIEYSFNRLESDNSNVNDYDENKIIFKLSLTEELWRW